MRIHVSTDPRPRGRSSPNICACPHAWPWSISVLLRQRCDTFRPLYVLPVLCMTSCLPMMGTVAQATQVYSGSADGFDTVAYSQPVLPRDSSRPVYCSSEPGRNLMCTSAFVSVCLLIYLHKRTVIAALRLFRRRSADVDPVRRSSTDAR